MPATVEKPVVTPATESAAPAPHGAAARSDESSLHSHSAALAADAQNHDPVAAEAEEAASLAEVFDQYRGDKTPTHITERAPAAAAAPNQTTTTGDGAPAGGRDSVGDLADEGQAVSPELAELAQSAYGLTKADLATYDSDRELQRDLRRLDQQLLQVGRNPPDRTAANPPATPAATPAAKANGEPAPATDPAAAGEGLDVKWFEDNGYDQDSLTFIRRAANEVAALKKELAEIKGTATFVQQLQAERKAQQEAQFWTEYDRTLDQLDPQLFGTRYAEDGSPQALTPEQIAARGKMWDSTKPMIVGLETVGQKLPLKQVVTRAYRNEHFDRILQTQQQAQRAKLRAQSNRRIGAGGNARPITEEPYQDDEANRPDIQAIFEKARG